MIDKTGSTNIPGYFKDHTDEELAKLALEQLKYNKRKKTNMNNGYGKDNPFFLDLQTEIVNRFVNSYKKNTDE